MGLFKIKRNINIGEAYLIQWRCKSGIIYLKVTFACKISFCVFILIFFKPKENLFCNGRIMGFLFWSVENTNEVRNIIVIIILVQIRKLVDNQGWFVPVKNREEWFLMINFFLDLQDLKKNWCNLSKNYKFSAVMSIQLTKKPINK